MPHHQHTRAVGPRLVLSSTAPRGKTSDIHLTRKHMAIHTTAWHNAAKVSCKGYFSRNWHDSTDHNGCSMALSEHACQRQQQITHRLHHTGCHTTPSLQQHVACSPANPLLVVLAQQAQPLRCLPSSVLQREDTDISLRNSGTVLTTKAARYTRA